MKLVIITAVAHFEKKVKELLKKSGINMFSYTDIKGFRDTSEENVGSNWFASDMNQSESLMFYSFAEQEKTNLLFENVDEFNKTQKTLSKIHVVVLNVEKSN